MKTSNFIKLSLKRKINILFISCLFFTFIANAQVSKVVAVDGYFTNKDSAYVISHLGKKFIKEIINISPDSAQTLIGEDGKFGILSISTIDPKNEKSKYFKSEDNKLFKGNPRLFIGGEDAGHIDVSRVNLEVFPEIRVLSQLESAQLYGKEKKYGIIFIKSQK